MEASVQNEITRAEAAEMIYNMIQKFNKRRGGISQPLFCICAYRN